MGSGLRLCLVTDRRRLAGALGRRPEDAIALLRDQIAGAVAGGVDLVQIRERDLEGGALYALVREAVSIAAGTSTRVVVNDRVDAALAAGAAGVHLREDSVAIAAVRALAPRGWLVGRSVHTADAAASAAQADYLIAGTLFETASKPPASGILGVDGLRTIVRAAVETPVFAIGGITRPRLALVRSAGAAGVAAISLFIPAHPVPDVASAVQNLVKTFDFTFDTGSTVS